MKYGVSRSGGHPLAWWGDRADGWGRGPRGTCAKTRVSSVYAHPFSAPKFFPTWRSKLGVNFVAGATLRLTKEDLAGSDLN